MCVKETSYIHKIGGIIESEVVIMLCWDSLSVQEP
jgi:hypothetical protein